MKSVAVFLVVQVVTVGVMSESCPKNLVQEAQICFSDLARAVHAELGPNTKIPDPGPGMTLDYSQIKKYCAKNGHMSTFVHCIEALVSSCENSPQTQILDRLVSPERVKQAVPTLCARQNEVESASKCMNSAMGLESKCKDESFARVKEEMARSSRNATAMFLNQCTFFHSLAECQRTTVADNCGAKFGDLHADFLLSFVPTSCVDGIDSVTSTTRAGDNMTSSTLGVDESINRTGDSDVVKGTHSPPEVGEIGRKMSVASEGVYKIVTTTAVSVSVDTETNSSCFLNHSFFFVFLMSIECFVILHI